MPLLLRSVNKAKWHNHWSGIPELSQIPADPLWDLRTQSNKLSIWWIEKDMSNFDAVISAIAATKDTFANVDYALIDSEAMLALSFKTEHTQGDTPHLDANQKWHRDLISLTAQGLVLLAQQVYASEMKRLSERSVAELLQKSFALGQLSVDKLKPTLRDKLQQLEPKD